VNEQEDKDDRGKESDFSDFARSRGPEPEAPHRISDGWGSSFARGCAIALGIAFLLFAFVVGVCFIGL
jgi:preprotein translocase subunit SecF